MPLHNLANEILLLIAKELEPPDLNSFLKVDHHLNALLTPLLTRVMIDDKNEILLWAAEKGRETLARLLLDNGADVNFCSLERWTPLQLATNSMNLKFVTFLLENGAKIDNSNASSSSSSSTRCNNTNTCCCALSLGTENALHTAARGDCISVAKLLLDSGADVNSAPQRYRRETALHIAASDGSFEMVELLLGYGADITKRDYLYYTPLGRAIERGNRCPPGDERVRASAIIKLLKGGGAVPDGIVFT